MDPYTKRKIVFFDLLSITKVSFVNILVANANDELKLEKDSFSSIDNFFN
jgi:hypothetical protein